MERIPLTVARWVVGLVLVNASVAADDWPQFRGPGRDGVSAETGLVRGWAESGPRERWRREIGEGFSAVSISHGGLYTADSREQGEFVLKLDPATGEEVWRRRIASTFEESEGNGPRSTPTVQGESLFIMSGDGHLAALRAEDGALLWVRDLEEELGAETPQWGFSSSPLVLDHRVIVEVGAPQHRSVAAFHARTGRLLWTAGEGGTAYSSPVKVNLSGATHLVFVDRLGLAGLSPDGRELWRFPWGESDIKPASPVFVAPDLVFAAASYGVGAASVRLKNVGGVVRVEELWQDPMLMRNHFSSSLTVQGLVYGFDNATLKCIDPRTAEQRWARRGGLGKGSLISADGMLVVLTETGVLKLVEAQGEEYRELASARVLSGRCWTAPSLAGGFLYLRNRDELVRLDLRSEATSAANDIDARPRSVGGK